MLTQTYLGVPDINEVPEAYGTIPGVYGPFGYGLGLTTEQAEGHAKAIAAAENVAPLPPDKMLAERLMVAVMNLGLSSIEEEKQVLNLMPKYGVKKEVVALAVAAVPPYETTPTTTTPTTTTGDRIQTAVTNLKSLPTPKAPIYKKWWFWLLIVGAGTGAVLIFTRKPTATA